MSQLGKLHPPTIDCEGAPCSDQAGTFIFALVLPLTSPQSFLDSPSMRQGLCEGKRIALAVTASPHLLGIGSTLLHLVLHLFQVWYPHVPPKMRPAGMGAAVLGGPLVMSLLWHQRTPQEEVTVCRGQAWGSRSDGTAQCHTFPGSCKSPEHL